MFWAAGMSDHKHKAQEPLLELMTTPLLIVECKEGFCWERRNLSDSHQPTSPHSHYPSLNLLLDLLPLNQVERLGKNLRKYEKTRTLSLTLEPDGGFYYYSSTRTQIMAKCSVSLLRRARLKLWFRRVNIVYLSLI